MAGKSTKASTKPKKPAKTPTTTERLEAVGIEAICEMVSDCKTLREIASEYSVSKGSLIAWLANYPDQYTRAREAQAETLAEDLLKIADDGLNDTYVDGDGNVRIDQDVIARSRLRVDARKWLAGKMAPKKYGDRLNLDADVTVTDITPEERSARIAALTAKLAKSQC